MAARSLLPKNERRRIEEECELLSRWFPHVFPAVLLRAIEQGKIHGGVFVDPEREGCGDPYGHIMGLPPEWQQAAQLARGVIAALDSVGEDMTPLQRWIAPVRPGQTQSSSQRLRILYDEILPKYLPAILDVGQMLQEAVNTISFMLMNSADSDGHRNPESGEIYSDVVRGAFFLEKAINAGIVPDNYGTDGVADLIEEVKAQEASPSDEEEQGNV